MIAKKPQAPNLAIAVWFQFEYHSRGVRDAGRWAAMHSVPLLFVLLLCGCRFERSVQHGGYTSSWPATNLPVASVDYGYSDERVHFVVFQTAEQRITPAAKLTCFSNSRGQQVCRGFIVLPNGTQQDLPSSGRIFELTYGQFRASNITFTTTQLVAYLDSDPKPPTIDGLTEFMKTRK